MVDKSATTSDRLSECILQQRTEWLSCKIPPIYQKKTFFKVRGRYVATLKN